MARPRLTAGLRWAPEYGPAMKTPHMTAKPQAIVITIHPAPLAFDFSSVQAAHTPSPSSIITIVPMNSKRHLSNNEISIVF